MGRKDRTKVILLSVASLLCSPALAQTHRHIAPPIIKGYEHPEQITDRQAWLMQLIASTSSDTDQDLTKKHAQIHRRSSGLGEFDLTLDEFRKNHDRLVANYNATISVDREAGASAFQQAAWTQLLRDIDRLVDDTVGRLRDGLRPEEWKTVDAHVQGVKSLMTVTVPQSADDPSPLSRLSEHWYYGGGPAIRPVYEIFDQQSYSGYSTYTALDTDGTNWIQTVYTMGSANVNGCVFDQYHGQWQPPGCPAQHSFYVTNQLNGSGPSNLHEGTWSYAQYVNLSQSWQAPYQEGVAVSSFSGGFISCNIIGTFFAFSSSQTFCDVNAAVVANTISSQCVQNPENASATVNSSVVNPSWKATSVSATSDKLVTITVQPTWLGNTYYTGARSALLGFKTNNPGNIYWNFTIACTGGNQTVTGTQKITCPGP